MHKVCNIRDQNLRSSLPPKQMWGAYVRDLEAMMDRALEGGFASLHSAAAAARKEAA